MSRLARRVAAAFLFAFAVALAMPAFANAELGIVSRGIAPAAPAEGSTATITLDVKVDQAPYILEMGCCGPGSLDTPAGRVILDENSPATQTATGSHEFNFNVGAQGAPAEQRQITVRVSDSSGQSVTQTFEFDAPTPPAPVIPPTPPEPTGPTQQAACPAVVTFGLVRARSSSACWQQFVGGTQIARRSGLDIPARATFYETRGAFSLNGIPFPPAPAGVSYVLVEPTATARGGQLGIDRTITINLGRVDLLRAPVRWQLPAPGGNGQLAAFNVPADTLGGLPVSGSAAITFRNLSGKFSTSFSLQITLPSIFKPFPGTDRGSITGATEIRTEDARGVSFDGGRIEVENAAIGSVALKKFCFSYMSANVSRNFSACEPPSLNGAPAVSCGPPARSQERFDASALVGIPTPQRADIGAYLGIAGGRFAYGGAFVDNARIPIVQGITLERIGLGVCVQPNLVVKIDGGLGFANGLVRGDASLTYRQQSARAFSIEVAGFLRVAGIPVGNGRMEVFSNGTVDFDLNAQMRLAGGFLIVNGGVGGFIQPRPFLFSIDGRIQVCIDIVIAQPCIARASVTASSIGVGGCGETFFGTYSAFFKWQQPARRRRSDFGRGCGFQNEVRVRRSVVARGARQAGDEPFSFPFPENPKQYVAHIEGQGPTPGSAPKVKITSPSGKVIESGSGPGMTDNQSYLLLENPDAPITTIFLPKTSAPGDWKVEPQAGSSVSGVSFQAEEKKPTVVTGKAKKRGKQWELDLKFAVRNGDKVSLDVIGDGYQQVLNTNLKGRACGGSAKIQGRTGGETRCAKVKYTPKFGYAGKRTVRATVIDGDGIPIESKTITTYRAGESPTPRKLSGVRIVRRGTTVFAVWGPGTDGTERYGSYVQLSDGRKLGHTAPKGCLAWRIENVARTTSVTLESQAGRLDQRFGPRAGVTLKGGKDYAGPAALRGKKVPKACPSI